MFLQNIAFFLTTYLNPVIELQLCNNAKYRLNVKQGRTQTLISGGGGGAGTGQPDP